MKISWILVYRDQLSAIECNYWNNFTKVNREVLQEYSMYVFEALFHTTSHIFRFIDVFINNFGSTSIISE